MNIEVPKIFIPIFESEKRYIVLYGGRGGGKSWFVALYCLIKAMEKKRRILCTREIQRTIKDSVYKLLVDLIQKYPEFEKFFIIKHDMICGVNGSEIIFKGLKHNPTEIKSTEGIDICWVEEAQNISKQSNDLLTPTIRKENSKIIYTYNPYSIKDVVKTEYIDKERDDVHKIRVLYLDNPFLPNVLLHEAEYDKKNDYMLYKHKWLGETLQYSNLLVFADKIVVDDYEYSDNIAIRYGADWGFSQDPTVLIKVVIDGKILYIEEEAYAIGCDIDKIPELFDRIEGVRKGLIIADSARPETISYIRNQGFNIRASIKGAGSVKEGIAFLRSFEKIIINPQCKHTINEFSNYKYKQDKITGEPLNDVQDGNDHTIDAVRYAIEDLMRYYTKAPNTRKNQKVGKSKMKELPAL